MRYLGIFSSICWLAGAASATDLDALFQTPAQTASSHRIASYDRAGGNDDTLSLAPGEKRSLASIKGRGIIRHLWVTLASEDPECLRRTVVRFFWDREKNPSVNVPIGDLFGMGQGLVTDFDSLPISVVAAEPRSKFPAGRGGMNLYFPMPFSSHALVEVENQSAKPLTCCFHIDYDLVRAGAISRARFHAAWRFEKLETPSGTVLSEGKRTGPDTWRHNKNLTGRDNYVVLEARGLGHYVGCVLSVDSRGTDTGKWWEGDDMIFIDQDRWPPRIHGTGTEDYFNLAWGFHRIVMHPFHGITFLEKRPGVDTRGYDGRYTIYRFHVVDPLVFQKSIRVTLEHGHANEAAVRYCSTAYWYQVEPHSPQPELPPPEARMWRDH